MNDFPKPAPGFGLTRYDRTPAKGSPCGLQSVHYVHVQHPSLAAMVAQQLRRHD